VFGYNSAESEPIWMKVGAVWVQYMVGGWPWQIFSASRAVATATEPGEFLFLSGKQRTISPISHRPNFTTFELNTTIGEAM